MTPFYRLRIGWEGRDAGVAVVGSAIVGTDAVGFPFTPIFTGPYDVLHDDSNAAVDDKMETFNITRGFSGDVSSLQAGQLALTVFDGNGLYNVDNPTSPLVGMIDAMLPVVLEMSYDGGATWKGRFYGWTTTIVPDTEHRRAVITAQDFFAWLGNQGMKPVIASTGPTTTGAAIGLILDAAGWTNPAMRSLAVGDSIPDFSADGTASALSLIQKLLAAERGRVWQRGDGVIVYENRHADWEKALAVTMDAKALRSVSPGVDIQNVVNKQRVLRNGGVEQTITDTTSDAKYGPREAVQISTDYLLGDTEADHVQSYASGLGRYIVGQKRTMRSTLWALPFKTIDTATLQAAVDREIGDRVAVSEALFGTSGEYHVLRTVEQAVKGSPLEVTWTLQKRPSAGPAIVGTSTVGGPDMVTY